MMGRAPEPAVCKECCCKEPPDIHHPRMAHKASPNNAKDAFKSSSFVNMDIIPKGREFGAPLGAAGAQHP
eukprot:6454744-Amphidinium_carterae.2